MKKIFLVLFAFITSMALAQETLSGYYINNNNQKITGEFAYGDYLSAESLKFRQGTGEFQKLSANDIKEYGISDSYKAVKYTVAIDGTDAAPGKFSANKDPLFEKRTVFLNVIAEGDVTLYSYADSRNTKYFIRKSTDEVPQQLVYRVYLKNDTQGVKNNEYMQQLVKTLVCSNIKDITIYRSKYEKNALTDLVVAYNECKGGGNVVYLNKGGSKFETIFSAYAGLYATSFDIKDGIPPTDGADKGVNFGIGAEMELLLPSKKLSLFFRAEYERFEAKLTSTRSAGGGSSTKTIYLYDTKANMISAFIGPRYYFNMMPKHRLFIDASVSATMQAGSDMKVSSYVTSTAITTQPEPLYGFTLGTALSFNIGVGYSFNNKLSLELRYNTNRDVLNEIPIGDKTKYSRMGVNVRYAFN